VTVELARRLVQIGAATAEVESALGRVLSRGITLAQALAEENPKLLELLERELERLNLPSIYAVRPLPELIMRLPNGICERLLAVPVHVDPKSGRVDIAAVEATDPHIAHEFAFHLQAQVRVLRAPYSEVHSALQGLASLIGSPASRRTPTYIPPRERTTTEPQFGSSERFQSSPPIPLVRRQSIAPGPKERRSTPAGDEPVLALASVRSTSGVRPAAVRSSAPPPAPTSAQAASKLSDAVAAISKASTPEKIVAALLSGLRPGLSVVFAVRPTAFEARGASAELGPGDAFKRVSVKVDQGSVLDLAVKAGYYLGPLPATAVHAELRRVLPIGAGEETYARLVLVSERPGMVVVTARFGPTLEGSRRVDELCRAAGRALERILVSRKRGQ
jgi:hypothetical protein